MTLFQVACCLYFIIGYMAMIRYAKQSWMEINLFDVLILFPILSISFWPFFGLFKVKVWKRD